MASVTWMCPLCGVALPIYLGTKARRRVGRQAVVEVTMTDTALADVFAHAWTHEEP